MLQYILTGLAVLALGVVALRIWLARETPADSPADIAEGDSEPAPAKLDGPAVRTRSLLIGTGILAVLGVSLFLFRSEDSAAPAGATNVATPDPALDDVDTMISRLADRLKNEPDDGEGFRMLGWSYVMTGKPEAAIAPYQRAIELLPDNAVVRAGYGEALVGVAKGVVTDRAKAEFDRAQAIDRTEPRSRYFLGLWLEQHGQQRKALDQWIALANDGPADAPWQSNVHRQIDKTAGELKLDISSRLTQPATVPVSGPGPEPGQADAAALSSLPPGEQQAAIEGMVGGLSKRLQTNPGDADGWIMLLRSRMVLGQAEMAAKDLVTARKALAGDDAGLKRVNDAARLEGVSGG